MSDFIFILINIFFIYCVLLFIKPKKFMPFYKNINRKKVVLIFFVGIISLGYLHNLSLTPEERARMEQERIIAQQEEERQKEIEKQQKLIEEQEKQKEEQEKQRLQELEKYKDLMEVTKVDLEQAKKIDKIFSDVELTNVRDYDYIGKDGDLSGYSYKSDQTGKGIGVFYLNKDKTMAKLILFGNILYENGKIKSSISDFTLTSSEEDKYFSQAKKAVKSQLNNPKSADFEETYYIYKEKGVVTVKGVVRATNAFNAIVPNIFIYKYNTKNNTYSVSFEN